ncbi:uncharacterized protein LOC128884474 [Hylaeus volcanicus]|uniref:uncharacterized protein LOC128884474 n=1 Tax=Hylaeus volcanicus TaxID=313075 RepID=UPI0023B7D12D|nr:uncharacterized protein LOC128884474 [Hylaeus volcanicus]
MKSVMSANHIIKRFMSSIFLEYGMRNIAKADSNSITSRGLFILNHQIRLIITDLSIWFYDKYFSSTYLSYSMVFTSLYIVSYNIQSFSAEAKTALQCPYLHGQFLSTFLSFAHLLCHQLNSKNSLISQCVVRVGQYSKGNPKDYLNCAQKNFEKLIDTLNSSVKQKKNIMALNTLSSTYTHGDCPSWQTDETIISLKAIHNQFVSCFSAFHDSPLRFFNSNLHLLIVSLWETCVNVSISSLQNYQVLSSHKCVSLLNDIYSPTELKDTQHHCHTENEIVDNAKVDTEKVSNKPQACNPIVGITLSISAVICSLMNVSIDLNIDENVVQSSRYVRSVLESLKFIKRLNGTYKLQVEAFQQFLLQSDRIFKIYSNWLLLLSQYSYNSSCFFHHLSMLLVYVKCFTGFSDTHQFNESTDRLIKDMSIHMSDILSQFFFHERTPKTHPIIYSASSDVQKVVFYIWNTLNFLVLDKNNYSQKHMSVWSPLITTLNMKQLSSDVVMCINDTLAYYKISSQKLKPSIFIENV